MPRTPRACLVVAVVVNLASCGFRGSDPVLDDGGGDNAPGLDAASVDGQLSRGPRCGDGVTDPDEECDDGNASNSDGCTSSCKLAVCGDGFVETGIEECDDGNLDTEVCPYAMVCTVCDATCHAVPGVVPVCGDGNIDRGHEICDDRNTLACGTCGNTCSLVVPPAAATATLQASPGADYTDGDSFTLNDGLGASSSHQVTFEFDNDGHVSPGAASVAFTATNDGATMAGKIADAINASGLRITATRVAPGTLVTLTNRQPSSTGNQPIGRTHLPGSTVLSASMSGGSAGDCANSVGCGSDADCKSNLCSTTTHQCVSCTINAQCATGLCSSTVGQCQLCANNGDCGAGRTCDVTTGVCH